MKNNKDFPETDIFQYRVFSLLDLNVDKSNYSEVFKIISKRKDLLTIFNSSSKNIEFIYKNRLTDILIDLNLKLIGAGVSSLDETQLLATLNILKNDEKWKEIPKEIVSFAQKNTLIERSFFECEYVFPIAFILKLIPIYQRFTNDLLVKYINLKTTYNFPDAINQFFGNFNKREEFIIKERTGLVDGKKKTLEVIGNKLGVTRERVRQIEARFWRKLHFSNARQLLFEIFMMDFIKRGWNLIYRTQLKNFKYQRFCLELLKIPYADLETSRTVVLGITNNDLFELIRNINLKSLKSLESKLASILHHNLHIHCPKKDLKMIVKNLSMQIKNNLTKAKKIYLTLKDIGKPVHYSELAKIYSQQYPNDHMTEHNIHAILSRQDKKIVWVGSKGIYALSEWGYKHPEKTMFETVKEIVEKLYSKTNKPVSLDAVLIEIGKYRKIVSCTGVVMALSFNKDIVSVGSNFYAPKLTCKIIDYGLKSKEKGLNEILKNFEGSLLI